MRWGKIVLAFQAIITILISISFFTQILSLDNAKIAELNIEMSRGPLFWNATTPTIIIDIKQRYTLAAYIHLIVGTFELLIISRLLS